MVYIYTLTDPRNNLIKYIGKTKDIKERYREHIRARKNNPCACWIKSLKNKNLKPIIEIIDEVDELNWEIMERYWISQFKTWGFNLKNIKDGGIGWNMGNHSTFIKGKKHNTATPVIALNKDGTFYKEYYGIVEAKKELGKSGISHCLSKKCKTAGGFIWIYKKDYDSIDIEELVQWANKRDNEEAIKKQRERISAIDYIPPMLGKRHSKETIKRLKEKNKGVLPPNATRIGCFKDNILIQEYHSINDAKLKTGFKNLYKYIDNERVDFNGYIWKRLCGAYAVV